MTRTYRNHQTDDCFYLVRQHNDEGIAISYKGGWKEAKTLLTKEDYAKARRQRGDTITRNLNFSGIPHWLRNKTEKTYRHLTKIQLRQYDDNSLINRKPECLDWYYWY